jgi:hypothetical protein
MGGSRMRAQHDLTQLHALYVRVFSSCDTHRSAKNRFSADLRTAQQSADDAHKLASHQATSEYQAAERDADALQKNISLDEKELVRLVAVTNLRVKAPDIPVSGVAPRPASSDIWMALTRHERELQLELSHLKNQVDRIRKTRSRWWFLLMFMR